MRLLHHTIILATFCYSSLSADLHAQIQLSESVEAEVTNIVLLRTTLDLSKGSIALLTLDSAESVSIEAKHEEVSPRDFFLYDISTSKRKLVMLADRSGAYEITIRKSGVGKVAVTLTLNEIVSAEAAPNKKVGSVLRHWHSAHSPGAFVVATQKGDVVFSGGFGYSNIEHAIEIGPRTVFDVASVAKQFTGVGIAMQVEQGVLSLDADIREVVPEAAELPDRVAIEQLIHHTGGIRDFHVAMWLGGWHDWNSPIERRDILDFVKRQRGLNFSPGSRYAYSNTGYNLLAETIAISDVSQESFASWCDTNLFSPLGMDETIVIESTNQVIPGRASGYSLREGGFVNQPCLLAAPGSSSILTTGKDMAKWMTNFDKGEIGGQEVLARLYDRGKLVGGEDVEYGYGLHHFNYRGISGVWHGGRVAGFITYFIRIPELQFSVLVMSNQDRSQPIDALAGFVPQVFLWNHLERLEEPVRVDRRNSDVREPPATVRDQFLSEFTGTYFSAEFDCNYRIRIAGDGLVAHSPHRHVLRLRHVGRDEFEANMLGLRFAFTRDEDNSIIGFNASIGDRVQNASFILRHPE
ncbi:MAG TPA: hypothetical protein DDW52_23095 [Planctomycetaceae bacterium]|nr:hypothetical protein [Planctomycetaceae bacterium]